MKVTFLSGECQQKIGHPASSARQHPALSHQTTSDMAATQQGCGASAAWKAAYDQYKCVVRLRHPQFNTTTSMGRLTLNVLPSFAQFEREVTSERIRDKIATSKRKGLWVGGMAPLGYDTKTGKITINEGEADRVREIFRGYLKLGTLNLLMDDLRTRRILTKVRTLKTGETVGGIPFTRCPLARLLRNQFYIGEVVFKGEILAGEQPAIVDRGLFEAVQAKLNEQVTNHKVARMKSAALFSSRIFDDRGRRMTPSHALRRGMKYRYYISSALLQGRPKQAVTVSRIPAGEIGSLVINCEVTLMYRWRSPRRSSSKNHVICVEVQPDQPVIELTEQTGSYQAEAEEPQRDRGAVAQDTIHPTPRDSRARIGGTSKYPPHPCREPRTPACIDCAGTPWLNELITDPTANTESIADRER
jgi:site-specific DNA recombinase